MPSVRLIHWHPAEAQERAGRLQALGFQVHHAAPNPPVLLKELAANPPAAVVIDLSRLPSQGRDLAVLLRERKGTRGIPLVFVGGEPEKVARLRALLPDATYTSWEEIGEALAQAIAQPPAAPVVPGSTFAAYAGRPLAAKLGIKANTVLTLVGAPEGFAAKLGELPPGVEVRQESVAGGDLTVWFVRWREELAGGLWRTAAAIGQGALWIAWPKKAAGLASDLSQQMVREAGLAAGLVDYKVCAVDETWSALLFRRRAQGAKHSLLGRRRRR
jgi:CheY-like chemotaxis protein